MINDVVRQASHQVKISHTARGQLLLSWLQQVMPNPTFEIESLAGDASFRRYFRVSHNQQSFIAMDAPPQQEDVRPFVAIARAWSLLGLNVPEIIAEDHVRGFLLLSDFGNQLLLDVLNNQTADTYYQLAIKSLFKIQNCRKIERYQLPVFTAVEYQREINLFFDWYVHRHCGLNLSQKEGQDFQAVCQHLIAELSVQPQVLVHRDYHSRNLMVLANDCLGILDFQDALIGPITYDIVSLFRDCYIAWPEDKVRQWVAQYHQQALSQGLLTMSSPEEFNKWFDWMTLQRNLKCIGIFARLYQRDNKSQYLADIPRVMKYAQQVCQRYPELSALLPLLSRCSMQ